MARHGSGVFLAAFLALSAVVARDAVATTPSLSLPALKVLPNTFFTMPVKAVVTEAYGIRLVFLVDTSKVLPDGIFIRYTAFVQPLVDWNRVRDTVFVSLASTVPVTLDNAVLVELAFRTQALALHDTLRLKWVAYPATNVNETPATLVDGQILNPLSVSATTSPVPFSLSQNTPNPFNPSTTIRFTLPEASPVRLVLYDVSGRVVRTLADGTYQPGAHAVVWDGFDRSGRACASGVYVYRLTAKQGVVTRRMTLLR